ncbi:hypothetical protein GCM10025868_12980 [Angustibacter aerolatus]|uniref:Uncharacterized protein n=1 Tax=Angustibacter aerolatus TaxID=1162965 RepID=A0ABQ6JCY1_9ACTN|nr:hypothetical protein GCM10025868_12980 [Angustibacter aerolatus]
MAVAGGTRWPVGVAVSVALTGCAAGLLRGIGVPFLGDAAMVAGWLTVVVLASLPTSEGDRLIVQDGRGTAWMLGGFTALVAVLVLARPRRPASRVEP